MKILLTGLLLFTIPCFSQQVITGAERTGEYLPLVRKKNIAVVANPASLIGSTHLVDSLVHLRIKVRKVFAPEHGFRSFEEAGKTIQSGMDSVTGIRVVSLYGKKKKPSPEDLKEIDLVLFDLQDVGVRFFTYISTLTYVMEACAENHVPLVVLDRPNPNGFYIDGPVLDTAYRSFVGLHPVPIVYGMTIGEYAQMVNGEGWLKNGVKCDLKVIPLEDYTHQTLYTLPVPPSPNLRNMNAVYLYPSLALFEGTVVSVGRGTPWPFEVFGSPEMKGFTFHFTPEPQKGSADNPPCNGKLCRGLDLRIFYKTHPRMFGRLNLGWLMMAFKDLSYDPDFFNAYFDKLAGSMTLRDQVRRTLTEQEIRQSWEPGLREFRYIRSSYLLYR